MRRTCAGPVRSPAGITRLAIVALHLVPGVAAYALLHLARRPLSELLGVSDATAQIGMMTAVMFSMAVAAFLIPVRAERWSLPETVRILGLRRWDPWGLALAGVFALVLLMLPTERWYEQGLAERLQGIEFLDLDRWHFQETGAFLEVPAWFAAVALLANIVGEELWFRGYLQPRLSLPRSSEWLAAGLLFMAYHVFEAPTAYPKFLGGLALAALYALRRDIWSCMTLHALLQAQV